MTKNMASMIHRHKALLSSSYLDSRVSLERFGQ